MRSNKCGSLKIKGDKNLWAHHSATNCCLPCFDLWRIVMTTLTFSFLKTALASFCLPYIRFDILLTWQWNCAELPSDRDAERRKNMTERSKVREGVRLIITEPEQILSFNDVSHITMCKPAWFCSVRQGACSLVPVWNTTQMIDGFLFELEVGHTNSFAVFSLQMFFLSWLQMSFLFSIFLFWSPFSHFVSLFHFLYREQWRYLLPWWMDATQFCCSLWMMSCYLHGGLKFTCPVWY